MMRDFLFFQISSVTANVWGFNRSHRARIPTLEIQPSTNFTDKVFYPKSVLQKMSKVKLKKYIFIFSTHENYLTHTLSGFELLNDPGN